MVEWYGADFALSHAMYVSDLVNATCQKGEATVRVYRVS